MNLDKLSKTIGEWLQGTGPDSDIVVSSRIRLARNLAQFPFLSRAENSVRTEIDSLLREKITALPLSKPLSYLQVHSMSKLDKQLLVERQLISNEHADGEGSRGVGISGEENISLMVNEEDHLRIQVLSSGFSVDECWNQVNQIDDYLESQVTYAFHEELGYLTACPTNVGTGIRASVMLHLPALVLSKEVQKVFQALQKIRLVVRGLYGEGSQAMGNFYQISNQTTLGKSEDQILSDLKKVIGQIIDYERQAREKLIREDRASLHDQIARAHGTLRSAVSITSQETMQLLSSVRMGINLGLIDDVNISVVNELFIHTQPAHLQKLQDEQLPTSERNTVRASYLRQRLAHPENGQN